VNVPEAATQSHTVPLADGVLELQWSEVTHRGRRRDANQDAMLALYPLFVVADGMGGHIGGEIASASTIERLRAVAAKGDVSPKTIERALARAVNDIAAHPETTDEGTGTTVTGVYLDLTGDEPTWVTLNVGDSRVYLFRDGVSPDYVRLEVVDGDRFVICSDGLTKELTDYGILHFLLQHDDPTEAVDDMLEAALENGGRDNVTIVVLNAHRTYTDAAASSPAGD
jgi:serine/threonine protein phosphatase PrpC